MHHTVFAPGPRLTEGSIVHYEGRNWFVGLVNDARARLDPLNAVQVASPTTGTPFASYGGSVNIGASSMVELVSEDLLNEVEVRRYRRLEIGRLEMAAVNANPEAGVAGSGAAKTTAQKNKERLEALKARKASEKAANGGVDPGEKKVKTPKEPKLCKCGCGQTTGGFFYPGHDAVFKGKLLKVERGIAKPEELFDDAVLKQYQWKKRGKGLIPTTNYKGEPHAGYDPDAATA